MIINEAEQIYQSDKIKCEEQFRKRNKNIRLIGSIIGLFFLFGGVGLLIWAAIIPPPSDSLLDDDIIQKMFGLISVIWAAGIIAFCWIVPLAAKTNYSSANKHLYQNYLRCTDMDDCDKEYYKELLADIRNAELANTIRNSAALVGAAKMYNSMRK